MPIDRPSERLIHFRFMLDLLRVVAPKPTRISVEQAQILAAIALGELEGRPFRITKLVEFLGMPRATLTARLNVLLRAGFILKRDGFYFPAPESVNSPIASRITDQVTVLILQAARELKNLPKG